jgi:hypothetical protein
MFFLKTLMKSSDDWHFTADILCEAWAFMLLTANLAAIRGWLPVDDSPMTI